MRTDCVRDNRKTFLPNASHLGHDLWWAKRGNWVRFEYCDRELFGRVIGGVTADGKRYLEICAVLGCFDNPCIRWIEPADVMSCRATPPVDVFNFMAGPWDNPEKLIAAIEYGIKEHA